jgi:hypothetical protein
MATPTGAPTSTPPPAAPGAPPAAAEPKQTWMPVTAGILAIVAGAGNLLTAPLVIFWGIAWTWFEGMGGVGGIIGLPWIILGIVAIIGGAFAIRRRAWGMALAGSICALMWPMSLLGILSIVFVAISKKEFK